MKTFTPAHWKVFRTGLFAYMLGGCLLASVFPFPEAVIKNMLLLLFSWALPYILFCFPFLWIKKIAAPMPKLIVEAIVLFFVPLVALMSFSMVFGSGAAVLLPPLLLVLGSFFALWFRRS